MLGTLLEQRYRIRNLIARGGMAAVYEALDERLERIVAVKLMHPTFAGDPVFADRFMREARAAAALNHPHIVAVFDQGHHDSVTYLVMEKVEGTTLRGILRQKGRLSPAEAVGVMEPILAALSQAHDRGFAHRDVKPENVLVSPSGVVKVADFGLARAMEGSHNLTSRSTLLGTVAYLSPEQIVNAESDARSDVYAAGILLYELLTGEKPYRGASAMDVAYQHVNNDLPAPSVKLPGLSRELDELVAHAARRDRSQRFATAGAFLTAIRQVRHHLGIVPKLVCAGTSGVPAGDPTPPDPGPWNNAPAQPLHPVAPPTANLDTPPVGKPVQPRTSTTVMPPPSGPQSGVLRGSAAPTPGPEYPPLPPSSYPELQTSGNLERKRLVLGLVAGAVALLLIVGGIWWYTSSNNVAAPKLVGLSKTEARKAVGDAGLKLRYGKAQYSDTVSENVVLSQKPGAKRTLDKGDAVTVVLSLGPRIRAIPSVRGKPRQEAENILKAAHFKSVITEEESQDVPGGSAVRTSPAEGTQANVDTQVGLVISKGRGSTTVPDVAGLPQGDAEALLQDHGLVPQVTTEASPDVDPGSVIRQDVPADSTVDKGTKITITVSSGPDLVDVPSVQGMSCKQAKKILTDKGFTANCQGSDNGSVFLQTPMGGTKAKSGSTITLFTFFGA
jgi:serine/threonine-protein kinase